MMADIWVRSMQPETDDDDGSYIYIGWEGNKASCCVDLHACAAASMMNDDACKHIISRQCKLKPSCATI